MTGSINSTALINIFPRKDDRDILIFAAENLVLEDSRLDCTYSVHSLLYCTALGLSCAQKLRQGIVMKTSFKTRVSRMGSGSYVIINIFVMQYYFYQFFLYSPFFQKSKSTQMLIP